MYWRSRKNDLQQEAPKALVAVWECESADCLGWMRKSFSLNEKPKCPLCQTSMKSGERMLCTITK
ncbi:cold-inducible protein YdjO-related protein [Ectobacillus panaciterrae]|uniref:cold-inducible protein YdjO-related protein n=1 Tax=Ectobacillus panaciterrae TaxID=363872 RepID=UPI0003FC5657|nr:cold-inducible protein YdjO-related protein [Ectobacillus panaciterrae]